MEQTTLTLDRQAYLERLKRVADLQREKEQRRVQRLLKARTEFPTFLETVLRDEASGKGIALAEIHLTWIEHIFYAWSHGLHAVILAPYGSGKTSILSIGLPLFCFGIDPSLRITLISANDTIAQERLVLVRQYIDQSEIYQEIFPRVKADPNMGWTQRRLYLQRPTFSKDASLTASGAVGSIIGKRNDLFIFDDINDAKNTIQQPKSRETIWTKFTGEYLSRLEPGGKIVIVACLTGDTPVLLADGSWKPLEAITPDDAVMGRTANGAQTHASVAQLIPQGFDDIYEVRTGNHTIKGNARHPLLTTRGWIRIDGLTKGDRLVVAGARPDELSTPAVLTEQEAKLLGFMFGDGWITINKKRNKDVVRDKRYATASYVTCFAHGNDEVVETAIVESFQAVFQCTPKRTKFGYRRTEVARIGRWFLDHGLHGKATTKRVPQWLFSQPEAVRQAFLDGLVMADGSENFRARISVSLCNGALVQDLKVLAEGLGYVVTNIYHRLIPNNAPHSTTPGPKHNFNIQWQNRKHRGPFRTETIRKITKLAIPQPVYDLVVPGPENFIANGIVSHNTRWHERDLVGSILADAEMRRKYAFLIQRVTDDFGGIECETIVPANLPEKIDARIEMAHLFKLHQAKVI